MLGKLIRDLLGTLRRRQTAAKHLTGVAASAMEAALAHQHNGRFVDAERIYRELLRTEPDNTDVLHLLGVALMNQGRLDAAIELLQRLTARAPAMAVAHFHLGDALRARGDVAGAVQHYRRAIDLDPNLAAAHSNLGGALRALRQFDASLAAYRRAVELRPDLAEAHYNLGVALFFGGRDVEEATGCFERAVDLDPQFVAAHNNLGFALRALGRFDASILTYRRAVELRPDSAAAHYDLGVALYFGGRDVKESARSFKRALELQPDHAEARFSHAIALLACGDLERGWRDYESRFDAGLGERRVPRLMFPQPEWQGEDLTGKSILVWGEQGIGDQICFAGLVPELVERARRCTVLCLPKLVRLFARSFPNAHVTAQINVTDSADVFDVQVPAGSVARWLRPTLASFPSRPAYLAADPQRVAYWHTRVGEFGGGLKVGICWRSSDLKDERAFEYTGLSQWGPIFAVPGVHFVNLQYDECAGELAQARGEFGVRLHHFPEVDMFDDLDETAALMKALDLVISAPTAVAAQAAALGLPCWQMSSDRDWSALGTEYYPWFPTMKSFRRTWEQPRSVLIEQVASELRRVALAHN